MSPPLSPEEMEHLAHRRAGAKLGWYAHATVYVLVNVALFALAAQGDGHPNWSIYPALGWGLGVVLHGVSVFVLAPGGRLRERLVQQERERLRRRQSDDRP